MWPQTGERQTAAPVERGRAGIAAGQPRENERVEVAQKGLPAVTAVPPPARKNVEVRHEDMRAAAWVVKRLGKKVASNIKLALVVPGSGLVKAQAESEGLDVIFKNAGFEWREPGCSMCLAMNADRLESGERCASTSNRNFEGRQGAGGRTHLVSPAMAAAAAIEGRFVDVRALA